MTEPNPLATPEPVWLTEATPLAEIDVELAHRLVERLLSTMRSQLNEAERRDLDDLDPPTIVTGVAEEMEGRFLGLLSLWSRAAYGWDGTAEGAEEIIDGAAEAQAEMVSHDYWVTDGWRTQTHYDPE